jgi:hypothetical protein
MREKLKDIQDYIFQPNNAKTVSLNEEVKEETNHFFTIFGEHDFIDEDGYPKTSEKSKHIYAKKMKQNGKTNFFVKASKQGKLYNPIGMFSEGNHKRINKLTGSNEYNFKRVNLRIFELYISFLKSRNLAWLNNAEREMI